MYGAEIKRATTASATVAATDGHRSVLCMELLLKACILVQDVYGLSQPVPSILRTVVRNAYRSATVVATEAIGVLHSWNCCSTLTSMCKSCINGRHRCAPLTELLLDALYRCATLIAMGVQLGRAFPFDDNTG